MRRIRIALLIIFAILLSATITYVYTFSATKNMSSIVTRAPANVAMIITDNKQEWGDWNIVENIDFGVISVNDSNELDFYIVNEGSATFKCTWAIISGNTKYSIFMVADKTTVQLLLDKDPSEGILPAWTISAKWGNNNIWTPETGYTYDINPLTGLFIAMTVKCEQYAIEGERVPFTIVIRADAI